MLTSALHKLKSVLHQKLQGWENTWEKNIWEFREDWLNFLSSRGNGDITKKQQTAGERKDLNINKDTLKSYVFIVTFTNQSPRL